MKIKMTGNFTQTPNELLANKEISNSAKLLYIFLLKYKGQDSTCFPGQSRLAKDMGYTDRYISTLLIELRDAGLLSWERGGYNTTNKYTPKLLPNKNYSSDKQKASTNYNSHAIRNIVPPPSGTGVRTTNTQLQTKDTKMSSEGFKRLEESMIEIGLLPQSRLNGYNEENQNEK